MADLIAICFRNIDFFQIQTNFYVILEKTKGKKPVFYYVTTLIFL